MFLRDFNKTISSLLLLNKYDKIIIKRQFNTSNICHGRRNFRKFPIPNKRGIFEHKKLPKELLENEYNYPIAVDDMKIRYPGIWFGKKFHYVKEMEPELIVPDFENCSLKPYVSYRTNEIEQSEFTAQHLFDATYGREIVKKFHKKEPIPESWLIPDEKEIKEAKNNASKTGSDLFNHTSYFGNIK